MKVLVTIIILLTLSTCCLFNKNGIEVKIKNNTDFPITSVKFFTSEKVAIKNFDKIEPNQNIMDFLSMKDNVRDGNYILEFTRVNGEKELVTCGYYTNGKALNQWIEFTIETDTITRKFSKREL